MATEVEVTTFWVFFQTALQEANLIVQQRVNSRDTLGVAPWDKMCYGIKSYVSFIFHKAARLVSMARFEDVSSVSTPQALEDKIDDELLDLINYAAMAWAYRKLQKVKALEENQQ